MHTCIHTCVCYQSSKVLAGQLVELQWGPLVVKLVHSTLLKRQRTCLPREFSLQSELMCCNQNSRRPAERVVLLPPMLLFAVCVAVCVSAPLSVLSLSEVLFALHVFLPTQEECRKVSFHLRAAKRTLVFIQDYIRCYFCTWMLQPKE